MYLPGVLHTELYYYMDDQVAREVYLKGMNKNVSSLMS